MKVRRLLLTLAALGGVMSSTLPVRAQDADVAGEISTTTALLQSRISESQRKEAGFQAGINGWARFEVADNPEFKRSVMTPWLRVEEKNDFVVKGVVGVPDPSLSSSLREMLSKEKLVNLNDEHDNAILYNREPLKADTLYYWRVTFGANLARLTSGPVHTFRTGGGALLSRPVRFAVVQGIDSALPAARTALAKVAAMKPDYVVFAGNSVYYDRPQGSPAKTVEALRARWRAFYALPEARALLSSAGTFWQKNDSDYRYAGADSTTEGEPSAALGLETFREQVPVTDPFDPASLTFRSVQLTRDIAVWLPEVRDFRTPSAAADSAEKTVWGPFQAEWLQRSLVNSKAGFRLVVHPTPLLGPVPAADRDNHANPQGYRTEQQAFLAHVKKENLPQAGLLVLTCASWQYHSVSPEGLEEISIGSLTTPLSGAAPVAPESGAIKQPFCPPQAAPGFALVEVTPATATEPAQLKISLIRADTGEVVYTTTRTSALKAK